MKPLERTLTFVLVAALHLGALFWVSQTLSPEPPEVVQPSMQGVLVPSQAPEPPQPKPTPPPPEPPKPEPPPPKPEPPKPKPVPKPKPKPPPPPLPPSEKAIEVPVEEAPPPEPPPTPPAPQETPPVTKPATPPPPGPAGPPTETPFTPPRMEASHLNNPAPSYPPVSRRMREEGRVLLDVHILPNGSVGEIKLRESSGFRRLDDAALSAVRNWRYVPATRGGQPIAFWYVQPVVFSLTQ